MLSTCRCQIEFRIQITKLYFELIQAIVSSQKEAVIGFPTNPSRHLGFFYVNVQIRFQVKGIAALI
ncbi:hypothetical protein SADUNF_Sadunf03G0004100 [Salix dunnii]|uniref:Uncharacterized protein n=1 Tax=Salix dunnii TaxID=1413687 RepID=A0A835KCC0_9ROSI|nr:hypothetical protein SADUNF_Sadunf03G0004100 [Salix dunnii]